MTLHHDNISDLTTWRHNAVPTEYVLLTDFLCGWSVGLECYLTSLSWNSDIGRGNFKRLFKVLLFSRRFYGLENWRRPPGHPHTTWMKTIQQDLKSNNLSLNEATDMAQNNPLWCLHLALCIPSGACRNKQKQMFQRTAAATSTLEILWWRAV